MAGCDANNVGGDNDASKKRVALWALLFAAIGALAIVLAFGLVGWGPVLVAALAGAILGFFVGSAIDWFSRLKEQRPRTITIAGAALCAGRNPFGFQPFSDGDWTCNMGGPLRLVLPHDLLPTAPGAKTDIDEIRYRAAPGSGLLRAWPSYNKDDHKDNILHCELSAHAGNYSVAAGAVGSGAGAAAGIGIGLGACAGLGFFTFGIGAALCALIVAALAAAGAFAGGVAGSLGGAFVGWLVDELGDFDKLGKTIEANKGCMIFLTGRWVTDISHEHNEIHDIEAVQLIPCVTVEGPTLHILDAAVATIGRRPTGDNPPIK